MTDDRSTIAELEVLSDDELKKHLRTELDKGNLDGETVRTIVHILLQRDAINPQEVPSSVKQEWKIFEETTKLEASIPERRKAHVSWKIGKIAAIAAVICAMVLAIPHAFGAKNFVQLIAMWSDDTFQFVQPNEPTSGKVKYVFKTDNPGLKKIYDTVTDLGVSVPVVPTWVPSGYELAELTSTEKPNGTKVCATLKNGEKSIVLLFYIMGNVDVDCLEVQKGAYEGEIKEIDGIQHYIMINADRQVITWFNDNVESAISTDLDKTLTEKILQSIYLKG